GSLGHQRSNSGGHLFDAQRNGEEPGLAANRPCGWLAVCSRRSNPRAAGRAQFDPQRRRGMGTQYDDTRNLLIATGEDGVKGVSVAVQDSGPGLDRNLSSTCSTRSTRPGLAAWEWDWRSAARLSTLTADEFSRRRTCRAAPSFVSPCRRSRTLRLDRRQSAGAAVDLTLREAPGADRRTRGP